jgi:PAS domain S-box-containing protein
VEVWSHAKHDNHIAMVSISGTGAIISCNNAGRELFGYPVGAMIGMGVDKLMPELYRKEHQAHVDRYVRTGVSQGAIGAWKRRTAVRFDGEQFDIRISLSVSITNDQYVISSLIDPLFEARIRTDPKGVITKAEGSPWLLFGHYRSAMVSENIAKLLVNSVDWFTPGERVIMCKNVAGEEFSALLRVKKDKEDLVGIFSKAPTLRVKILVLESGMIEDCEGESKALLGFKPKVMIGRHMSDFMPEDEVATISLDTKLVVQMHHRNGRTIFVGLRVTRVKDVGGRTLYQALLKGHTKEADGLGLKGEKLRYGGEVLGWYELGPSLGHGMCGPVKRAVHRLTGEEVAIKTLSKHRYNELGMNWPPSKIEMMDRIRHSNLVRMFDTISTGDEIMVIMELIDGGEFFDYCERMGAVPENEARVFWRQLLSGVEYLHRLNICHRDIKLDNLVLDAKHNLKLIDFGFATSFEENEELNVFCGSPDYAAPELVSSIKYKGPAVDIWACGVVLYVMTTSYLPFSSPDRIRSIRWDWPPGSTPSSSLQNLLKSIFQPASLRATTEQLLAEPWGVETFSEPIKHPDKEGPVQEEHLDMEILEDMEKNYGWVQDEVVAALTDHSTNQITTTYHLLQYKKENAKVTKNPIWGNDIIKAQSKSKQKCALM